jgi:hypothetical protein
LTGGAGVVGRRGCDTLATVTRSRLRGRAANARASRGAGRGAGARASNAALSRGRRMTTCRILATPTASGGRCGPSAPVVRRRAGVVVSLLALSRREGRRDVGAARRKLRRRRSAIRDVGADREPERGVRCPGAPRQRHAHRSRPSKQRTPVPPRRERAAGGRGPHHGVPAGHHAGPAVPPTTSRARARARRARRRASGRGRGRRPGRPRSTPAATSPRAAPGCRRWSRRTSPPAAARR